MGFSADGIVGMLHGCSLRATPQRIAVIKALGAAAGTHLTAETVYSFVCRDISSCSLSTVYHALDSLSRARLVEAIRADLNCAHYGMIGDEHFHFFCASCNSVRDIPASSSDWTCSIIPQGYTACSRQVVIRGVCERCETPARTDA